MVGVLYLAGAIPEILMSLLGGVLADRLPKKYVMMAGQASYLLTSLFVALALITGMLSQEREGSWIILVAVTALRGVVVGLVALSGPVLSGILGITDFKIDLVMISDSALERSTSLIVLNSESSEHLNITAVHTYRNSNF